MKSIINTPHMHRVAIYTPYWRHLLYIKHKEVSNYGSNSGNSNSYYCDVRVYRAIFSETKIIKDWYEEN